MADDIEIIIMDEDITTNDLVGATKIKIANYLGF
jgi:hypothetical protein